MIRQLGDVVVRLALSLHAANDEAQRDHAINETNNLKAIIDALNHFHSFRQY